MTTCVSIRDKLAYLSCISVGHVSLDLEFYTVRSLYTKVLLGRYSRCLVSSHTGRERTQLVAEFSNICIDPTSTTQRSELDNLKWKRGDQPHTSWFLVQPMISLIPFPSPKAHVLHCNFGPKEEKILRIAKALNCTAFLASSEGIGKTPGQLFQSHMDPLYIGTESNTYRCEGENVVASRP